MRRGLVEPLTCAGSDRVALSIWTRAIKTFCRSGYSRMTTGVPSGFA